MKEIKIVLWDLGNVFMKTIHEGLLDNIFKKNNNNILIEEYKNKTSQILNKSFYGLITLEETWNELFNVAKINDQNLRKEIINNVKAEKNIELIKFVGKLKKIGIKQGIVSDLSQIGYYTILNNFGELLENIEPDLVFVSVKENKSKLKDGKEWFGEIIKKIGVDPSDILFVDDNENTIKNVRELGVNCIQYKKDIKSKEWMEANNILFNEIKHYIKEH